MRPCVRIASTNIFMGFSNELLTPAIGIFQNFKHLKPFSLTIINTYSALQLISILSNDRRISIAGDVTHKWHEINLGRTSTLDIV
jgi:hypothetical protein